MAFGSGGFDFSLPDGPVFIDPNKRIKAVKGTKQGRYEPLAPYLKKVQHIDIEAQWDLVQIKRSV